jgi:hypothetical protein
MIITSLKFAALVWVMFTIITDVFRKEISKLPNWTQRFICLKCITFWSILIATGNIYIAALSSLINYIIENTIKTKL